jgi:hypothetical protein
MPLPKSLCSTLVAAVYKRPAEGGLEAFCFLPWGFGGLGFWDFGLGFGLIFLLWAFWCGKLLKGNRITEGKRIAKGKLLKGKVWLKRD